MHKNGAYLNPCNYSSFFGISKYSLMNCSAAAGLICPSARGSDRMKVEGGEGVCSQQGAVKIAVTLTGSLN